MKDFFKDTGIDPVAKHDEVLTKVDMADAGLEPLRKKSPVASRYGRIINPSPWQRGTRVKHRRDGREGVITFAGISGGRCIIVHWDNPESTEMHEAEELMPQTIPETKREIR